MKLYVTDFITVTTEKCGDYFAAVTKPFALTGYGDTEEMAEQRALMAVFLLASNYKEGDVPIEARKE